MDNDTLASSFEAITAERDTPRATVCFILGSGWGDIDLDLQVHWELPYARIPCMGTPEVEGHAGKLVYGTHSGHNLLVFHGRRHWYEGAGWEPVAFPLYFARRCGVQVLGLTCASGGIREELQPGAIVLLRDHINLMCDTPLRGPHAPLWGTRFPDQTAVYDPALIDIARKAATCCGVALQEGIYATVPGPAYETPAEIAALSVLGADVVGMSVAHEATLGHAAGMRVLALSCVTNKAAGLSHTRLSHADVLSCTQTRLPLMQSLMRALITSLPHNDQS